MVWTIEWRHLSTWVTTAIRPIADGPVWKGGEVPVDLSIATSTGTITQLLSSQDPT